MGPGGGGEGLCTWTCVGVRGYLKDFGAPPHGPLIPLPTQYDDVLSAHLNVYILFFTKSMIIVYYITGFFPT